MTDKFPNVNSQAVESAARLHDVQERARAASPVSTHGKDILHDVPHDPRSLTLDNFQNHYRKF